MTENDQATRLSISAHMSLREQLSQINATVDAQEASVVTEVGDGIAHISGLKTAMAGELLQFTSSVSGRSVYGLAQNLDEYEVGAVLFGDVDAIKEGDECRTTGRVMDIPVGHAMLGRVVNPLGQPIDGLGPIDHAPIDPSSSRLRASWHASRSASPCSDGTSRHRRDGAHWPRPA